MRSLVKILAGLEVSVPFRFPVASATLLIAGDDIPVSFLFKYDWFWRSVMNTVLTGPDKDD